jgi:peptidoglycan/xylan/chitin deacetylase (PgdA/CDA1 family)
MRSAEHTSIAVVIPCFNLGHFVGEAVASVLGQSRQAAEIIVVDDGSTDVHTLQVLSRLSAPNLRVYRRSHQGAAAARNYGVAQTTSGYLLFLDADDLLAAEYLERTASRLDGDATVDFVSTSVEGFGDASYVWKPPPIDLATALTRGTIPITALFRRQIWTATGGFDESLPTSMDLDFWLRAMEHGFRGTVLDEPLFRRRTRADSLHHTSVARRDQVETLSRILRGHEQAIQHVGPEIVVRKEQFLLEQRQNREQLLQKKAALEHELAALNEDIRATSDEVSAAGLEPVDLGEFRRSTPFSPFWGLERGRPVDRYYIEGFLDRNRDAIRGRVLEVKDSHYTRGFGGTQVSAADVLDIDARNPQATVIADLTAADAIPDDSFDCFILTQTLHIIYDVRAAVRHAYRILRPGGVLLITLPAISRINYEDGGLDGGDYWRFGEESVRALVGEHFPPEAFDVAAAGNRKSATAFLFGLSVQELTSAELDDADPSLPLVFCVRAVKPLGAIGSGAGSTAAARLECASFKAAVLMYHRVGNPATYRPAACVAASTFRAHVAFLMRHYRVVPLEELVQALAGRSMPERAIALTFDDGTLDALEVAAPILVELGAPATFFVNSDRLDERHEPWWDTVSRVLFDGPTPDVLELGINGALAALPIRSAVERASAYDAIQGHLIGASAAERDGVIAWLTAWCGRPLAPRDSHRVMLGTEVRRLAQLPGISIGSHTIRHLSLDRQPADVVREEVVGCKAHLEQLLQRPVPLFAYPYGRQDALSAALVRQTYTAAVTTEPALVGLTADSMRLPRVEVADVEVPQLARHLDEMFAHSYT